MPIYEYICGKCGEAFELLVRCSDDGKSIECPQCGSKKCEKKYSTFASHGAANGSACSTSGGSCCGCTSTSCSTCSR